MTHLTEADRARLSRPQQLLKDAANLASDLHWHTAQRRTDDPIALERHALALAVRAYFKANPTVILTCLSQALDDANQRQLADRVLALEAQHGQGGQRWEDIISTDLSSTSLHDAIAALDRAATAEAENYLPAYQINTSLNQRKLEGLGNLIAHYLDWGWGMEILDFFTIALPEGNPVIAAALSAMADAQRAAFRAYRLESAAAKPVALDSPLTAKGTLQPCCEACSDVEAQPTSLFSPSVGDDPPTVKRGYTLISLHCNCPSRWLDHDFKRLGQLQFLTVKTKASKALK